jgi:hypothetical protein
MRDHRKSGRSHGHAKPHCALAVVVFAILAAAAPGPIAGSAMAAPGSTFPILVMGDSYSAGNGAGSYSKPSGCYRSSKDYAALYVAALTRPSYSQPATLTNVACSGDTTNGFFAKENGQAPQINAVNGSYGLILLTTGGDDANFAAIVEQCLVYGTRDGKKCDTYLTAAEKLLNDGTLEARLRHVLSAIHERADPLATIALLGYPYLEKDTNYTLPGPHHKPVEIGRRLKALEDKGDAIQERVVSQLDAQDDSTSLVFVPTKKLFAGHELSAAHSNPNRWFVEPFSTFSTSTWYHPNPKGWAEEANLLLREPSIPKQMLLPPPAPPPPPPPPPPAEPSPPANEEPGVVTFPGSPLTVSVGQLGQCQSSYEGSGDNYFPPDSNVGDCGFFLAFPASGAGQPPALQGTTWGFNGTAGPHGLDLYTAMSQSPITGSGTEADPYTEVTVFKLFDSEEREDAFVTDTTTYVNGATQFTSTYDVKNTTTGPIYFRAIYAGDLYVGGDDFGPSVFEAGPPRFVGGQNPENGAIGGFLEAGELPWSSFEEGCWNATLEETEGRCPGAGPSDGGIWHTVETTAEEPRAFNELTESTAVDNGVGVEWDQLREAGLPAGQEQAFKIVNVYRP